MTNPVERGWTSAVGPLPQSILPGRLPASPDALAEALIAAVRREISAGLARAYLAGVQAASSDPCSLCRGTGCASPTCRRPA